MDIKKYNKIRDMYKPGATPLTEKDSFKRSTLSDGGNEWSDPTTNIKKPTSKPVTTGFDSFFEGVSGLGKRINEAGGWKAYFQGKKDKKNAAKAGMTVEEYNSQGKDAIAEATKEGQDELGKLPWEEGYTPENDAHDTRETYDPANDPYAKIQDEYANSLKGDVETDNTESDAGETDVITEQIETTNNPPPPPEDEEEEEEEEEEEAPFVPNKRRVPFSGDIKEGIIAANRYMNK